MTKRQIIILIGFVIIVIAIPVTLYLVRQTQIFKPRAAFIPKVEFVDAAGQVITETTDPNVKLKITKEAAPTPSPSPSVSPSSSPSPSPSPAQTACADGTEDQTYSATMVGCNGSGSGQSVLFSQAASLCAQGWHVCSLDEYLLRGGRTIASNNRDRWLDSRAGASAISCPPSSFAIPRATSSNSSFSSGPGCGVFIDACGQNSSCINASSHDAQLWGAVCCQ